MPAFVGITVFANLSRLEAIRMVAPERALLHARREALPQLHRHFRRQLRREFGDAGR